MEKRQPQNSKDEKVNPGVIVDSYGRPLGETETWSGKRPDKDKEGKESLALKEKLNLALAKLREIIAKLPADGRARARAEHTLRSVESALKKLGKDGKYPVAVEGYEGNPCKPYVQEEGVPVDELIDILKNYAKDLNKNMPTKKTLADLWEKYQLANEMDLGGDQTKYKHTLYSEWERAKKAYEAGYFEDAKELDNLADELFKNSEGYFEAHYTKAHGEGGPWTEEEKNKQDLRTRYEAKLVSLDYRGTGSEEGDYKAAMEILKYRRELKLEEKKKEEVVIVDPIPPEPPEPPIKPEVAPPVPPVPPVKPEKPPKTSDSLLAVDVTNIAEQLARQRATERLNVILNKKGILNWFNKHRYRAAEEMYRQRFYREELAKIQDQQNVFADPARKAEHDAEMKAEFQRFQEDLFRTHGGENKETLNDPEFNAEITQLMRDYATSAMTDDDFTERKYKILQAVNKKYPNSFGPGKLSADNFLEAGREFRKCAEHGEGLARLDAGLKVDLGIAKRVVRTDANLRWIDKAIAGIQKVPILSNVLTPSVMAAGLSIGTYLGKKPAYWLGGAVGAGLIMGGLRRAKDVKVDVATHRMERAMGRDLADFADAKGRRMNREKMEKFLYATRSADELKTSLSALTREAASGDPTAVTNLINDVADAEARMSLAETKSIDLIHYEGERVLSQSRLELLRIVAEAKVQITDKGALHTAITDRVTALSKDVGDVDRKFTWFRTKETAKAAVIGGVLGGTIGVLLQEGLDKIGIHPPNGRQPALERLWDYLRGKNSGASVPIDWTHSYAPLHQGNIGAHVPQGTILIESPTGISSLVDSRTRAVLADNIVFGRDGQIVNWHEVPGSGISVESHLTHTPAGNTHDYLQANRHTYENQLQEVHRHGHLMNETIKPDLNELKLQYGGINGTGYDAAGNVVIDLKHLTQFGSFQGSRHPDITQLLHDGKIKVLITPDTGDQNHALIASLDSTGKLTIPGNASFVHTLFGRDASGRLTHPGFLEAVIADDDGKFTPIATDPDGGRFVPGLLDGYQHTFHKNIGRDWNVPPFIPIFPRKPLEDYKGSGDAKNFGGQTEEQKSEKEGRGTKEEVIRGKNIGESYDDLPDPNDPIKKFGKRLKSKTQVASREQILEGEKNLGAEYPNQHRFYTPQEIVQLILYGEVPVLTEDEKLIRGKSADEILAYFEDRIKADKEKYEGEEAKKRYAEIISKAYKAVDGLMSKYGGEKGRSPMPARDKIHLLGFYDYYSQAKELALSTGGCCFIDSGEIFINMVTMEKLDPNNVDEAILHTVSHEVTHAAVANNYWGFEAEEEDEKVYATRRSGLKMTSRQSKYNANMPVLKERGRALNEAVTEELSLEAYRAAGGRLDLSNRYYLAERRVLKALQEKFKIDFRVFAEAVVNRRKLPALVREMSKSGKKVNADFVSMLMAIMDYESKRPGCRDTYPQTIALIKGEQVNVDATDIRSYLGAKFTNKDGSLKETAKKKYNIKTWGEKQIAA